MFPCTSGTREYFPGQGQDSLGMWLARRGERGVVGRDQIGEWKRENGDSRGKDHGATFESGKQKTDMGSFAAINNIMSWHTCRWNPKCVSVLLIQFQDSDGSWQLRSQAGIDCHHVFVHFPTLWEMTAVCEGPPEWVCEGREKIQHTYTQRQRGSCCHPWHLELPLLMHVNLSCLSLTPPLSLAPFRPQEPAGKTLLAVVVIGSTCNI